MRRLTVVMWMAACGSGEGRKASVPVEPSPPPITVEWKVEQGDGHTVNVSLVVNGTTIAIGPLDAATATEAGTPSTCALRAASPRRTELVCGDANAYSADLVERELVISLVAGGSAQRSEVKRIPVTGDVLAVKMLVLPGSKL